MKLNKARSVLLASTMLCGLSVAPAFAQENIKLKTITIEGEGTGEAADSIVAKRSVAAAKTDTPLLETPQVVNVVTRKQMDVQGANTVAEALRYTPGVMSDPNGYDVRYDWLYIRGFNSYGTM